MSEWNPDQFARLLTARAVDVAIGPTSKTLPDSIRSTEFLRYQLIAVVGAQHPLAGLKTSPAAMAAQTWLLGPSAVDPSSSASRMLRHFRVPEERQRIFPNHAAALTDARSGHGVALCPGHAAVAELSDGRLVRVDVPGAMVDGVWATFALRHDTRQSARERNHPVRVDAAGDPGDAHRKRREHRTLQAPRARDALELIELMA